jgi:hypothetical protein
MRPASSNPVMQVTKDVNKWCIYIWQRNRSLARVVDDCSLESYRIRPAPRKPRGLEHAMKPGLQYQSQPDTVIASLMVQVYNKFGCRASKTHPPIPQDTHTSQLRNRIQSSKQYLKRVCSWPLANYQATRNAENSRHEERYYTSCIRFK